MTDGIAANPASCAVNHATMTGPMIFTGPQGNFAVTPKQAINAAGPWIDAVNASLNAPSRLIGRATGPHIVMDHPDLVQALKAG